MTTLPLTLELPDDWPLHVAVHTAIRKVAYDHGYDTYVAPGPELHFPRHADGSGVQAFLETLGLADQLEQEAPE